MMRTSKPGWKVVAIQLAVCCACVGCKKGNDDRAAPAATAEPAQSVAQAEAPAPAQEPTSAPTPAAPASAAPVPIPGPAAVAAKMSGTLTLTPNPVPICDKTGLGATTVKWTAEGVKNVEVHIGSPDGKLFLAGHGKAGSGKTGAWVNKDMTFYLQATDDNAPREANYTLAAITADAATGGACP